MEEKKNEIISWIKAYKKQLLLAGVSITAVIGVIIGLKNKEAIVNLWDFLKRNLTRHSEGQITPSCSAVVTPFAVEEVVSIRSYTSSQKAFDVNRDIRNLSGGRHHSAEKAAEAATLGIVLLPHQTIVDTYTKCAA